MSYILLHLKNLRTRSGILGMSVWSSRKRALDSYCVSGVDIRCTLVDCGNRKNRVETKLKQVQNWMRLLPGVGGSELSKG